MDQRELKKLEKKIVKFNRKLERLQMQYRIATGYEFLIPYGPEVRDDKFQAEENSHYDWSFADENLRDEDLPGFEDIEQAPF